MSSNNAINSDGQKRRFALLLHAGYGERWASRLYTGSTRTPLRYNISAYEGEQ